MMKKLMMFSVAWMLPMVLWAAPFGPDGMPIEFTQPDGTVLELRVYGDEFYAVTRTNDGFTVIFDDAQHGYVYTKLNDAQTEFVSTGIVLGKNVTPPRESYQVDLPKDVIQKIVQEKRAETPESAGFTPASRGGIQAFADLSATVVRGITFLVYFQDDDVTNLVSRDSVDDLMNTLGRPYHGGEYENTGSVRDYFYDQSFGKLDYTTYVTPQILLPHNRAYYNYYDPETKTNFLPCGVAATRLLEDAIAQYQSMDAEGWAEAKKTFTLTPNRTIMVNVLFAGSSSGKHMYGLWPCKLGDPSLIDIRDDIYCFEFQVTNIGYKNSRELALGTIIHENGHLLCGFRDYYDYSNTCAGIGDHCLMATGNSNNRGYTPADINGYLKLRKGWMSAIDIDKNVVEQDASLDAAGRTVYRFKNPSDANEFYVIENRSKTQKWSKFAPSEGLLIWHVDESFYSNDYSSSRTYNSHGNLTLEQADGQFALEGSNESTYHNKGDAGDAFSSASATTSFSTSTTPNSNWWNNSPSGFTLYSPSKAQQVMTFSVGPIPANSITLDAMFEEAVIGLPSVIRWNTEATGDAKIELFNSRGLVETIAPSVNIASKSFSWTPLVSVKPRPDYFFKITLLSDATIYKKSPVFGIVKEYSIVVNETVEAGSSKIYPIPVPAGTVTDVDFRVNIAAPTGYLPTNGFNALVLGGPQTTAYSSGVVAGRTKTPMMGIKMEAFFPVVSGFSKLENVVYDESSTNLAGAGCSYVGRVNPNISDGYWKLSDLNGAVAAGNWKVYMDVDGYYGSTVQVNSFGLRITFAQPEVSIASTATGTMGNSLSIPFTLSESASVPLTLPFQLTGTAVKGTHFNLGGTNATLGADGWGEIVIPANATSANLVLNFPSNTRRIGDRALTLTLDYADSATRSASAYTQEITLVDPLPYPAVSFLTSSTTTNYEAQTLEIPVHLSAASGESASAQYTINATADSNIDYVASEGAVSFKPGEMVDTIRLQILKSGRTTPSEIKLNLFNPINLTALNVEHVISLTSECAIDVPELQVTNGTRADGIYLNWTPVDGQEYMILRKAEGDTEFTTLQAWGMVTDSFLDTNTIPWRTYHYVLRARLAE